MWAREMVQVLLQEREWQETVKEAPPQGRKPVPVILQPYPGSVCPVSGSREAEAGESGDRPMQSLTIYLIFFPYFYGSWLTLSAKAFCRLIKFNYIIAKKKVKCNCILQKDFYL